MQPPFSPAPDDQPSPFSPPPHNAPPYGSQPPYEQQPYGPPLPAPYALDGSVATSPAMEEPITVRWVARDVKSLLVRPTPTLPPPSKPWRVWSRIVGLYLIAMVFAGIAASLAAKASGATNMLDDMRKAASTTSGKIGLLFLAGVLAPLWEETAFRLALAPFKAWRVLLASLLGFVFLNASLLLSLLNSLLGVPVSGRGDGVNLAGFIVSIPLLLGALLALAALSSRATGEKIARAWHERFGLVLLTLCLCFGFAHAGNWSFKSATYALLIPLLVLPQLIAGVLLAYTRIKLGFWFAVLLHATVNTTFMLIAINAPDEKPKPAPKPRTISVQKLPDARPWNAPQRPARERAA